MAPDRAKIFFVDDNIDFRETRTEYLEEKGHRVVETAGSRKEVKEKLPYLVERGVNVAVVDGDLSGRRNTRDGEEVIKEIRTVGSGIKIIGSTLSGNVPGADFNCSKKEGREKFEEAVRKA